MVGLIFHCHACSRARYQFLSHFNSNSLWSVLLIPKLLSQVRPITITFTQGEVFLTFIIFSTDVLPKFHYWCWTTITGFTGVILTLQVGIIYIFAVSRRKFFRLFWLTHKSYPILYFLTILHGSGYLVQVWNFTLSLWRNWEISLFQEPFFYYFFLGPCILFTIDKIISISRKSVEKVVWKAEHLPSSKGLIKL